MAGIELVRSLWAIADDRRLLNRHFENDDVIDSNIPKWLEIDLKTICLGIVQDPDLHEVFEDSGLLNFLEDHVQQTVLDDLPTTRGPHRKLIALARAINDDHVALSDYFYLSVEDLSQIRQLSGALCARIKAHGKNSTDGNGADTPLATRRGGGRRLVKNLGVVRKLNRLYGCLFETFLDRSRCYEPLPFHHSVNLRLPDPFIDYEDCQGLPSFDILLDLPERFAQNQAADIWQDVNVKFLMDLSGTQVYHLDQKFTLCKMASSVLQENRLGIELAHMPLNPVARLVNLSYYKPQLQRNLHYLSLGGLLDENYFEETESTNTDHIGEMKAMLILTLASAMLHIPQESWFHHIWSVDKIVFIYNRFSPDRGGVNIKQPYLHSKISSVDPPEGDLPGLPPINRFFLSFALLILQIQEGKRAPEQFDRYEPAQEILRNAKHLTENVRKAVLACISFDASLNRSRERRAAAKRWDRIFIGIMLPLLEHLRESTAPEPKYHAHKQGQRGVTPPHPSHSVGGTMLTVENEPRESAPMEVRSMRDAPDGTAGGVHSVQEQIHEPGFSDGTKKLSLSRTSARSANKHLAGEINDLTLYDDLVQVPPNDPTVEEKHDTYLRKSQGFYDDYLSVINRTGENGAKNRIRVAILDSGLHPPSIPKNLLLKKAFDENRITKIDFLGGDCGDSNGHGTHVATIFTRFAQGAEILIVKISDEVTTSNIDPIVQAIKYAVEEWKADIVSMSFGLDVRHLELEDTLHPILNSKRGRRSPVFFAAASNNGAHARRAFPAGERGVIGVNASDGNGESTRRLSPGPEPNDENFTTLGLHVRLKWEGKTIWKSGTSFATPIAAAIAANLLDIAQHMVGLEEKDRDWLFSPWGVKALLKEFSDEVEHGYNFICPWKPPYAELLTRTHVERFIERAIMARFSPET